MWIPFRRQHRHWRGYLLRGIKISILLMTAFYAFCLYQVYQGGKMRLPEHCHGDVAVVLGAAAWDMRPSPVFLERINHAIALYQGGKVDYLAFTGGTPKVGFMTEAEVGRRYALRQGVPERAIVLENTSRDTYHNLANIEPVLKARGLDHIVVVSDPYHLARAKIMAEDLGITADYSPTPTTRYSKTATKLKFLFQETHQLFAYYLLRAGEYLFHPHEAV